MSAAFDPYYLWLGIGPEEQPPNHYRLLGLSPFESNANVIDHAADRVLMHLRSLAGGSHAAQSQRLMNEVLAARICLLDPAQRARYDAALRSRLSTPAAAASPPARPVPLRPVAAPAVPKAQPLPMQPSPAQPIAHAAMPAPPQAVQPILVHPVGLSQSAPGSMASSTSHRPRNRKDKGDAAVPAIVGVVKIVLGALGGLSMALLIVWVFFRADPLGLFADPGGKVAAGAKKSKVVVVQRPAARSPVDEATSGAPPSSASAGASAANRTADSTAAASQAASSSAEEGRQPTSSAMPPEIGPPQAAPLTPDPNPVVQEQPHTPHPRPSQADEQAKLAELKDVYKSEFEASTRPGSRETFPDFLLATADRLQSDPVARFVLFREALTRLIAARQFETAVEVVDRLEQEFVLDPLALRIHTLTKASEAAKLPAEKLTIVLCASEMAEIALARQRLPDATALARMADAHARNLTDAELKNRVGALRVEVEKSAEQWGPVERARAALAADPQDAAAATVDGRYRCLVQGDWKEGLPLLARGSDEKLGAAARQDQAGASGDTKPADIGEMWFALAQSEEKLAGFFARARYWYGQALADARGLDRLRAEERIKEIERKNLPGRLLSDAPPADTPLPSFVAMFTKTASFEPVDLFKFVVPKELLASPWNYDRSATAADPAIYIDAGAAFGRVPAHFTPPREYQVSVRAARTYSGSSSRNAASGPLVLGLVGPRGQFAAVLDLPLAGGYASLITLADAKTPDANPSVMRHPAPLLRAGSSSSVGNNVVCQVRRNSISLLVDGQLACRHEGDQSKLALPREWSMADNRSLFLGAHVSGYSVRQWRLDPLPKEQPPTTLPFSGQAFPPLPGQPPPR